MKEIEEIVRTEIVRLHAKQQVGPLEITDVKQLVELSRAWKYLHETPPPQEGDGLSHIGPADLLAAYKKLQEDEVKLK